MSDNVKPLRPDYSSEHPAHSPGAPRPDRPRKPGALQRLRHEIRETLHALRQRPLLSFPVAAALSVATGLGWYWFVYTDSHLTTEDAYIEGDIHHVNSRIMGYVSSVAVRENEEVRAGQLIASLDDTDVNVELRYKEARYNKAKGDAERATRMRQSGAISVSDLENAQAMLTVAQADLDGSLLKKKYTRVLAPVDGRMAKIAVRAGQFVQPGQSLAVVVPSDQIWIKANYRETEIRGIRAGQKVRVWVDAYPGQEFEGKVEGVFPSSGASLSLIPPENATGNFTKVVQRFSVKVSVVPDKAFELKPGMSVRTMVLTK